jgi:hypothetical protein
VAAMPAVVAATLAGAGALKPAVVAAMPAVVAATLAAATLAAVALKPAVAVAMPAAGAAMPVVVAATLAAAVALKLAVAAVALAAAVAPKQAVAQARRRAPERSPVVGRQAPARVAQVAAVPVLGVAKEVSARSTDASVLVNPAVSPRQCLVRPCRDPRSATSSPVAGRADPDQSHAVTADQSRRDEIIRSRLQAPPPATKKYRKMKQYRITESPPLARGKKPPLGICT